MRRFKVLAAAAILAVPFAAGAQDGQAAVKKLGCLKCHAVS